MKFVLFLIFLWFFQNIPMGLSSMKLTNVVCKNLTSFVDFTVCRIKAIDRNTNALYVTGSLKHPVNNAFIDLQLVKWANGWKPFLYEFKNIDLCRFMRLSTDKRNKFFAYLYSLFARYSNFNHPCPFGGNMTVAGLIFREDLSGELPIPLGEYGLVTVWRTGGVDVASINGYIKYTNYKKVW